jgi:hypothetical protein
MSGPSSVGTPRLLTGLTPQPAALCVSMVGLFCEPATPVRVNLKGRGLPTDEVNAGWRGGMAWSISTMGLQPEWYLLNLVVPRF